jgi:DVNP family
VRCNDLGNNCIYFYIYRIYTMKRPVRGDNGMYMISGKSYKELFGSRSQVFNGTAYKTSGGLTKTALTMNKWGRIVSEKKHKTAKKEKRLQKYGFFAQKGKFGYVKRSTRKSRSKKGGDAAAASAAVPAEESTTLAPATL